jgi:hypothetical protein
MVAEFVASKGVRSEIGLVLVPEVRKHQGSFRCGGIGDIDGHHAGIVVCPATASVFVEKRIVGEVSVDGPVSILRIDDRGVVIHVVSVVGLPVAIDINEHVHVIRGTAIAFPHGLGCSIDECDACRPAGIDLCCFSVCKWLNDTRVISLCKDAGKEERSLLIGRPAYGNGQRAVRGCSAAAAPFLRCRVHM